MKTLFTVLIFLSVCSAIEAADSTQVLRERGRAAVMQQMGKVGKGQTKGLEVLQADTDVDPKTWYVPGKPYLRVRTRQDGVARINGSGAIEAVPALDNVAIAQLALFYKGSERPITVTDADSNGRFSSSDTVWFQGRHPFGDTTWLDRYDTTAVYFLTVRDSGTRRRFDWLPENGGVTGGDRVQHVMLDERYELDTGFYHLGNASSEVNSTYNTFWATYEGYYWANLRALSKSRFTQPLSLYPSPQGSVSVSAHVIASTDAVQVLDNRADLMVNGAAHVFFEREGVGGEVLTSTQSGSQMPAGEVSFALYCPGVASAFNEPGYYSDVMLDYITITGDVLPVLTNGALRFHTPSQGAQMEIPLIGSRSSRVAVMDTTNQQFAIHIASERGTIVAASLAPVNPGNVIEPETATAMRYFMRIDDAVFRLDSSEQFVLVYREPNGTAQILTDANSSTIALRLTTIASGSVVALLGNDALSSTSNAELSAAMSLVHLQIPTETHWVVTGVVRESPPGNVAASNERVAIGVTSWLASPVGSLWAPTLGLYGGPDRTLYVNDMQSVEEARVEPAHLSNLNADSSAVDYFYITHKNHRANAERLAEFRRKHNAVKTRVVDVDDVIDEFGAGQRSPEAIRNYLKHAWASAPLPKPRYLMLVGNATWDPRIAIPFGNVGSKRPDQVPTFGRPSSDYWYGLLDDEYDIYVPELIVGRIPAISAAESQAQIDKIIQSDTIPFAPWMRRWQFVGGGSESEGICDMYNNMLSDVFQTGVTFLDAPFCIDTSTLCRYTAPVNAGFYLRKSIDEGVQWMNYLGHGATNTFDINGWDASELTNTGRYGVLATYACQTGSYSNPSTASENVEYVLASNRGFMAAMGGTGWEFQETVSALHFKIHELMRNGERNLGALMYSGKLQFANGLATGVNTIMQYNLLGDPLSRVRMDTIPDPYLRPQDVTIVDPVGSTQITDDGGSMIITAFVQNAGTGTRDPVTVRVRRTFDGKTDSLDLVLVDGICGSGVVRCTLDVAGRVGEHQLTIEVDPSNTFGDDHANNTFTKTIPVFARTVLPIYPHANGMVSATKPKPIRVLDPSTTAQNIVTFVIAPLPDETLSLRRSAPSELARTGSVVDWNVGSLSNDILGEQWLGAWTTTTSGGRSAIMWVPITVTSGDLNYGVLSQSLGRFNTADTDALVIDSIAGTIALRSATHNIYIQSSGVQTSDLDRNPILILKIAQTEIVRNSYRRGINIVVLSQYDTVPRAVRRYDTWKFPTPIETGHNGFAKECLTFLSDSLLPTDRIMFAACDESFTAFEDGNLMDSLRVLLKGLGSGYADSLRASSSWAMIGHPGLAPGTAPELWKGYPDSMVKLTSQLEFFAKQGTAVSDWLGPARRISSIVLGRPTGGALGDGVSATLVGRTRSGVETELLTTDYSILLPGLTDTTIRDVRAIYELHADSATTLPQTLGLIRVFYEPADEWVLEPDALSVDPSDVMRGDTVQAKVHVRNARPEQTSNTVALHASATGSTLTERVFELDTIVPVIAADASLDVVIPIPSASLGTVSTVTATIDPDQRSAESYTFNNNRTTSVGVREDSDTPTIEVRVDNARVSDGSFVYIHPYFEVLLHDNSNLQISDPNKLTVFINGTRIRENSSTEYDFLNTASVYGRYDANDVRAATRFRFLLEIGQNNMLVKASDATGNSTNYEIAIFTSTSVNIADVEPYPNPTTGPTTFSVALADTMPMRPAVLEIFDLQGGRLRALPLLLTVGQGTVSWDGRGEEGVSVATGLYMWKLSATDAGGEPLSHRIGTLTVLR